MPETFVPRWIKNINGATRPYIQKGLFQAGGTQAIVRGQLLEFTGDTNTKWVPMDADFAMNSNVAIANEDINDGDLAGYYEIIVPRPGDVFEFALASASAVANAAPLYFSSATVVTTSAGSNIIGNSVGQDHLPQKQTHLTEGQQGDRGTTIKSTSTVQMLITETASIYSLFQTG